MAGLINREQRDRTKRLKKERMEAILDAGLRAFLRFAYVDVSLAQVGKLAGVPQGKPEIYFGTREELFLQVFSRQAAQWFADLEARFAEPGGEFDPAQAATILAASLESRPELLRLLGLLHMVLDQNIEIVSGSLFLRQLKLWMASCGEGMEAACGWLAAGDGFRVLNRLLNFSSSLYSVCYPTGAFAMMVSDDDLDGFKMDLSSELRELALRLLDAT